MLDTVVLESPFLDKSTFSKLKTNVIKKLAIDCNTGDILYSFTTSNLVGSFDYRIRVFLDDSKYKVTVECSLAKLLQGHNVIGNPIDWYKSVCYLVNFLSVQFNVDLPCFYFWEVKRVDIAFIYDLYNLDSVRYFIDSLKDLSYPRRSRYIYGSDTIYWAGSTTTIKFYAKGPEFKRHDYKRIKNCFGVTNANLLLEIAKRLLRVEVEIRGRKLKYIFGEYPKVSQLDINFFNKIYDEEINKIMCNKKDYFKGDVSVKRFADDVYNVLLSNYSNKLAKSLFGTWQMLCNLGVDKTKKILSNSTFYRHRRLLSDVGVVWYGTDIEFIDDVKLKNDRLNKNVVIPSDFCLDRVNNKYLVYGQSPVINDIFNNLILIS